MVVEWSEQRGRPSHERQDIRLVDRQEGAGDHGIGRVCVDELHRAVGRTLTWRQRAASGDRHNRGAGRAEGLRYAETEAAAGADDHGSFTVKVTHAKHTPFLARYV